MNRKSRFSTTLSTLEQRRLTLPVTLTALLLYASLILYGIVSEPSGLAKLFLLFLGIAGVLYSLMLFFFIPPYPSRLSKWRWLISVSNGLALGVISIVLPSNLNNIVFILIILTAIVSTIALGRRPTYLFILVSIAAHLTEERGHISLLGWVIDLSPYMLAAVTVEIITRLQDANQHDIKRLETINEFARQITSTLEMNQVTSLISAAIQKSLEADTYYVALLKEDHFALNLFYDDGEYFNNVEIPVENTLAGWVANNRQSLLIHDLPNEQEKLNLNLMQIEKDKVSLSWMGTPLQTGHTIMGVIAVASYKLNAFDHADLELLENLTQQASLAIDNAYHHAEVEHQSHLDSLTQAFTHGYFLEVLQKEADEALINHAFISLIMLDIDYFKQYNDNYGHLVGDKVLTILTDTIRRHIKNTDAVGRWGGEEFAIMLLNARFCTSVSLFL